MIADANVRLCFFFTGVYLFFQPPWCLISHEWIMKCFKLHAYVSLFGLDPDHSHNIINCSLYHCLAILISYQNPFITFCRNVAWSCSFGTLKQLPTFLYLNPSTCMEGTNVRGCVEGCLLN